MNHPKEIFERNCWDDESFHRWANLYWYLYIYTFQGRHKFTQPNDYSTYTTAVIINVSGVEQSRLLQAIDKDQITI